MEQGSAGHGGGWWSEHWQPNGGLAAEESVSRWQSNGRSSERSSCARGNGFRLPRGLGEPVATRRFSSTYHDTSDHRLATSGFTLRYRNEQGSGAWQLKLPRESDRLELELPAARIWCRPASATCWRPPPVAGRWGRWRPSRPSARAWSSREQGRDLAEVVVDEVQVRGNRAAVSRLDEPGGGAGGR